MLSGFQTYECLVISNLETEKCVSQIVVISVFQAVHTAAVF